MSRAPALFLAFLLAVSLANADGVSAPGAPHSIGSQGFEIKYLPGGGSAPAAPVNSVAPVVSGSTVNGSLLSTTTGAWSGSPSFSYQWQRNGSPISGATASTYTTQPADGGTLVGVQVTATNAGGSASALSNTLAIASANMSTPIFSSLGTSVPSPSATNYATFGSSGSGWGTTLAGRSIASPFAGKISGWNVAATGAVSGGYYQIKLYVAGTGTTLLCTFGISGGANYGSANGCTDYNAGDAATVNPQDLLSIESTVSGTPTTPGILKISALLTSTNGQESPIFIAFSTASQTALSFVGPFPTGISFQATDAIASWVSPGAGILKNLGIVMSAAAGATREWTWTVFKNGVAAAIVAGDATHCGGTSSTSCFDLSNTVAVAAKDTISIQACPSAVSPLSGANCTTGVGQPANSTEAVSIGWVPSTPNQAVVIANGLPPSKTSNNFTPMVGQVARSTGELGPQNAVPGVPTSVTFGNLTTAICPDAGAGVNRSVTARMNSASQAPTLTLPGSGTVVCPTLQIVQDTADTYAASSGALVNYLNKLDTSVGATTLSEFKTSMTAVVQ